MPHTPRKPSHSPKGGYRPPVRPGKSAPRSNAVPSGESGWDPVAAWYDKLVGETGSDYHQHVILPAAMRLLAPQKGNRVIDICCGQGVLVRPLLAAGVDAFKGVDASPRLIAAAKKYYGAEERVQFEVADASAAGAWADGSYDLAACLMAVHDVRNQAGLFVNVAKSLKSCGRAVLIMMHPCFRVPRHSHWGWDADQKIQYRRMDLYASGAEIAITTHPGKNSGEQTAFHHRPLQAIINDLGSAGLAVVGCEELCSHRRSQGNGPYSKAEHKAAGEFPLFMALSVVRVA